MKNNLVGNNPFISGKSTKNQSKTGQKNLKIIIGETLTQAENQYEQKELNVITNKLSTPTTQQTKNIYKESLVIPIKYLKRIQHE